jgi:AcrR family transcriptional regulator
VIAELAGVTARTFFRYVTDKREVLFAASAELEEKSDGDHGQRRSRERELIKLAHMSAALADGLRWRGIDDTEVDTADDLDLRDAIRRQARPE